MFEKILDNRFLVIYLLPFCIGALTVFSFQPYNFTYINFILLPMLFALVVFVSKRTKNVYRKRPYKRNLFLIGFIFGFGFYLSGIYWIAYSLTFDESFKILIPFYIIIIPLFLGLFMGLTILIIGPYINYNIFSVFLFSGSYAFSDYIRGKILTGFPWNLLGYSWSWFTEILQILNFLGLYAFNLIAITIFTLPAIFFFRTKLSSKILVFSLASAFIFLTYLFGTFSINKNKNLLNFLTKDEKIYIKAISPNFKLDYNLPINIIEEKLKKVIRYSNPDQSKKTVFIWPEGIFSGYDIDDIINFKKIIKQNFSQSHLILLGINSIDETTGHYFNSLILINNEFEILGKYNKKKLVPFGEFLPFENLLNKVGLKKITQGHGSFLKGQKQKNILIDDLNILPLICYEIIFPELIQKADDDTNIIVNISEDGWFGNSIGPHQHFAKAIFRAIENDTFLIRSANQGVTAIISNKGEIVKKLNTYEAGNIELNVPLIKSGYKNKNDLIFFILLFTYLLIFLIFKNKTNAKK